MQKINTAISRNQFAVWSGMIGPIFFVATFATEGWLRTGYHPLAMYVSALSLGPRGWIQVVNFIVFGILLLAFSLGIAAKFKNEKVSQAGPVLLTIIATGYLLSGPFIMDPEGTLRSQLTLHGTLHGLLGGIVFLLMPVSCFVFHRRFGKDPKWQSLRGWTLVSGIIISLAVILLTVATKLPATQNAFSGWHGFIQRAAIVPFMAWVFTFALKLNKERR